MSETLLIDYADARPKPADIVKSGYVGVVRYLSETAAKNLSASEAKELHAAGLAIALVWETTADRATAGRAAGVADCRTAEQQAAALGYPAECPIFYACDEEVSAIQASGYYQGVDATCSRPSGPYGEGALIDFCNLHKLSTVGWQTAAWSDGTVSTNADLYQRVGHTAPSIPGGGYDEDVVLAPLRMWGPTGVVVVKPPSPAKPKPKTHPFHWLMRRRLRAVTRGLKPRTHAPSAKDDQLLAAAEAEIRRVRALKP